MLDRIAATIARHRMLEPGQLLGVAVSGGADSVCLLHVLRELDPSLRISVLHLNHQLRGAESDADEAFVRNLAASLGYPFFSQSVDVSQLAAQTGDNLEQAARKARREFLIGFVLSKRVERVALGHTRSDQAETVLFRFLRGAGTTGMAGIRPVTRDGFIRPLIDVDRPDVVNYLKENDLSWREDASNADLSFSRNRIRHQLLPALAREWNPELAATLSGMAQLAQDEEAWWDAEIARVLQGHVSCSGDRIILDAEWLGTLAPAVARRVVRWAIRSSKGDLLGVDLRHVEGVLDMLRHSEGSLRRQVPGVDVFRSFDWVRFAPAGCDNQTERDYEFSVSPPVQLALPGRSGVRSLQVVDAKDSEISGTATATNGYNGEDGSELNWGEVAGDLCVRNWRPGDRYHPLGYTREIKVKQLFQDFRIPLWERRSWPIITSGGRIVWAARFGPATEFAASPATRARLRVQAIVNENSGRSRCG